ncbi:MAG: LptF/LptG family permease [Candidatus Omnitrophica bacterium]|nr:LptF/LptG family permease [Candidatus Omnitrophota bacterium]
MRILERHIVKSVIQIFFSTVLVFCFLYILIDATSNLDEIIDRKVALAVLVKYYLSFFPVILVQTSSIACLIAVLLTFSSLNNQNEILAMRAGGLNFWQITRPALCFSLVVAAAVFFVNEQIIPTAAATTQQIRDENMMLKVDRIRKNTEVIRNMTLYGLKNRLYFIDSYNPRDEVLEGITIIEHDANQNIEQKIVALRGVWTGIAWKFYQCQITVFNPVNITSPVKIKVYKEKLMDIKETPDDFLSQRLNVSSMNIRQLSLYITKFATSGAQKALQSLRVDMHQRIAFPIGNVVIVLAGLPFALMFKSRKGATFTALGIAVGTGFLYYVVNAVSIAFGKGGFFPPVVAAWATPALFAMVALSVIESNP